MNLAGAVIAAKHADVYGVPFGDIAGLQSVAEFGQRLTDAEVGVWRGGRSCHNQSSQGSEGEDWLEKHGG